MVTLPPPDDEIKVRVDSDLKRAFQRACKARDMNASQVLRHLMRAYVTDCSKGRQPGLFEPTPPSTPT